MQKFKHTYCSQFIGRCMDLSLSCNLRPRGPWCRAKFFGQVMKPGRERDRRGENLTYHFTSLTTFRPQDILIPGKRFCKLGAGGHLVDWLKATSSLMSQVGEDFCQLEWKVLTGLPHSRSLATGIRGLCPTQCLFFNPALLRLMP
jgi:hypothetical protein